MQSPTAASGPPLIAVVAAPPSINYRARALPIPRAKISGASTPASARRRSIPPDIRATRTQSECNGLAGPEEGPHSPCCTFLRGGETRKRGLRHALSFLQRPRRRPAIYDDRPRYPGRALRLTLAMVGSRAAAAWAWEAVPPLTGIYGGATGGES